MDDMLSLMPELISHANYMSDTTGPRHATMHRNPGKTGSEAVSVPRIDCPLT